MSEVDAEGAPATGDVTRRIVIVGEGDGCIFPPGTPARAVPMNIHFDNSRGALQRLVDALRDAPPSGQGET